MAYAGAVKPVSRREMLKRTGSAGGVLAASALASAQTARQSLADGANGTVVARTSTSDVFVPPRGRGFMKFSFDFPEPSVVFDGYEVGFRVFTRENVYSLASDNVRAAVVDGGLDVTCTELIWAGGQQRAPGRLVAHLRKRGDTIECDATVEMERPIKAVALILRGVPRGRLSAGGAPFFDPRDDEILLGYPFSGGDLIGPQGNGGLTTPLVLVQPAEGSIVALSSLDNRVRTKRFYFQPGERGYRVEATVEAEGWNPFRTVSVPAWRIARVSTIAEAGRAHYDHLERAFRIPRWDTRPDVPAWMRRTSLVVTLHGMHYTGYIFNDYARQLAILRGMATRSPGEQVLGFLATRDGRYYWDYPNYRPSDRMGGEAGFRTLIKDGQALGFKMMPMFGANAANREQPVFARIAEPATTKIDGDRMDLN